MPSVSNSARGPLAGDDLPAERGARSHRPVLPAAADPATLEVAGIAVEQAVTARAIALGGQQTRRTGLRVDALDEIDIGLLAGLDRAALVIQGG